MKRCLHALAVVALLAVGALPGSLPAAEDQQSVLVTGASTGIGRHLAETLAEAGHHVYAGARKEADLEALNAIENITAVRLDVTKQADIDAAVALIQARGTGLYGLVNNAGIGDGGPVLDTPVEIQTLVYDINVEGVYRVTKAFAPLVIESQGRIATTGSIAGTISWAGGSAYSGSKHWIEAFTDALAGEMEPLGVSVSVIQPGNYQSNIRRSAVQRRHDRIMAAGGERTDQMAEEFEATAARELSYNEPDDVSAAYLHALFDEMPLRRYVVVPNAEEQAMTIGASVQRLLQLNAWGPHRYSKEALLQLIEQAMAEGDD